MNIFTKITDDLTKLIETDLFSKSADLITNIAPIFLIGFSIYVLLLGLNWLRQGVDENLVGTAKSLTGWLIVIALAFNANNYSTVAQSIYAAPDEVASWLTGNTLSTGFVETQLQNVDSAVTQIKLMSDEVGSLDFAESISLAIAQFVIYLIGYVTVIFIWGFYMITKFSLALTLVLGPIFIGAMLFPATRQYGMNWIGQILNYIVTVSLYMGISLIQLQYVESTFSNFEAPTKTSWGREVVTVDLGTVWGLIGSLLIITIIFAPIVFSIPQIAAALTGGAGVDGHGRIMERMARGSVTGGIGAFKGGVGAFKSAGRQLNRFRGNTMSNKGN